MMDVSILDNNLNDKVSYYEFFSAFGYSDRDTVFLRSFKDKGEKDGGRNTSFLLKDFTFYKKTLHEENQRDRGIFFVVNGGGQSDREVKKARAQFIDFDDFPFEEQLQRLNAFPLEPSIIIKTRKSLHPYWILDDGEIKYFREVQQRLIQYFGSDSTIQNESRVMRLYGFEHRKTDNPVMVTLIKFNPELRYTQKQFHEALPLLKHATETKQQTIDKNAETVPVGKGHFYVVKKIGEYLARLEDSADDKSILALVETDFMSKYEDTSRIDIEDFRKKYLKTISKIRALHKAEQKDPGFYSFALKAWKEENPGKEFNTDIVSWDEVGEAGRRAKLKLENILPADGDDLIAEDFSTGETETIDLETGEIIRAAGADPQQITGEKIHLANPAAAAPAGNTKGYPDWIFQVKTKSGLVKHINEPVFCDHFKTEHHLARVNGVFYYEGRAVSDDFILNEIQNLVQQYFVERVGRLTQNIFITLSNACYTMQPYPDERKVYCADNVSLILNEMGEISRIEEDVFTLTRIPVPYDPAATCPTFEKYLHDLFYDEDIPAIQEFVGYCLIPSTRAQAALFIHGKGGEGKSVFRDVIMKLFGHTVKQEAICNLEKAFVMANLENILLCIDDDMQTALMGETATLKRIITMKGQQQVERKHQQKHDALIFARIIGIGNSFIGSKFDQSDGFYRRQLLIDCRPKTRETDDRFMSDKCLAEIQGIFNWALVGLSRLIKNRFQFSVSERMKNTLDSIRRENDNVLAFLENNVEDTKNPDDYISSADLFNAYALDCKDNGDVPVKKKTFQSRISDRYRDRKDRKLISVSVRGYAQPVKRKVCVYTGIRFEMQPRITQSKWDARLNDTTLSEDIYLEHLT